MTGASTPRLGMITRHPRPMSGSFGGVHPGAGLAPPPPPAEVESDRPLEVEIEPGAPTGGTERRVGPAGDARLSEAFGWAEVTTPRASAAHSASRGTRSGARCLPLLRMCPQARRIRRTPAIAPTNRALISAISQGAVPLEAVPPAPVWIPPPGTGFTVVVVVSELFDWLVSSVSDDTTPVFVTVPS